MEKANVPRKWTIHLPFTLSPGKTISLLDEDHQSQIGQWECRLSGGGQSYTLKVFGLPDRDKAEAFVQRLGGSLLWTRVSVQTGIHFDLNLDKLIYFEDPKAAARNIFGPETERKVDCIIDSARTAVYPSDKQIATITAGAVTATQGIPPDRFVLALAEGICLPNAAQIVENERIRLASEIYSHSHFESSLKSRFLGQMTVLEVLSERPQQPSCLQDRIDRWAIEIEEARRRSRDPDEKRSLERLTSRIHGLKEESITESVRIIVRKALAYLEDTKASELVSRIGPLYGIRSGMVHGTSVDLGQSPAQLQEIVSKTLSAVMRYPALLTESDGIT
ncbi:MAG: hypothetical protein IIA72_06255 [Proteobacteria bacterium]|nr:hypothetical protein [Pseudomonadota bacterium]